MLLLTIAIIGLLGFINYQYGRRSFLYPPVFFCFVWAVDLLLVYAAGDFFYPLSPPTLFIFICGAVAFSLGSWLTSFFAAGRTQPDPPLSRTPNRILNLLVCAVVLLAPICYRAMTSLSAGYGPNLMFAAYMAQGDELNQSDLRLVLFQQVSTFAIIFTMIAFYEFEKGRLRFILVLTCALLMCLLTGNRNAIGLLACFMVCVDWIKRGRIRWKVFAVLGVVIVLLFGGVAIYVGKANADPNASLADNMAPVAQGFLVYASGGIIGFDELVREPNTVEHVSQIDRIPRQTLNKLGVHFDVPNIHAHFVNVGPYGVTQNVFTFYFTYMDWGFAAMMLLVALIGCIATLFYRKAVAGDRLAGLIYGALFFGLMMTPYNENFFIGLNVLSKVFVTGWLFYRFPAIWSRFSQRIRENVKRQLVASTEN